MPPQALVIALFILQEAIKVGPDLAAQLAALFSKPDPTEGDWEALRASVLGLSYAQAVPQSALPAAELAGLAIVPSPEPAAAPEPAQAPAAAAPEAAAPAFSGLHMTGEPCLNL